MKNFIYEIGISHVKSKFHIWITEFHIWNLTIHMWKILCETESHMNFLIHIWNSYMWKQITYEIYMWKHITYEILNSYMKFYMWKQITYEILYVKTNHIWNPRFTYEILYVKINHILNLRFIYEYQYVKTNRIWNPKFIHVYVLYHRNAQFILDWISHACITYEFSHREYSNLSACYYLIFNTTLTPKKVKNQIVSNYI